jgi:beta-glucanase (GH16 family)
MASSLSRREFVQRTAAAGLLGAVGPGAASAAAEDPTLNRTLVFEDAFETIDWSVWNAGPKAGTWDTGFYGRSAFARQTGEEGFLPYSIVDDVNASKGKALQIAATYMGGTMKVPKYYGNNLPEFQWISGNLQTARRDGTITKSWRKGYFEARMLFPAHPLTWPAFWMLNGRSILFPKTSIEIDVVEHKGFEPNVYGTYLHEWGGDDQHHESTGVKTPVKMTEGYCRYGVLITDRSCTPFFDRQPVTDTRTGKPAEWPITRSKEMDANGDTFWPLLTLALRSDVRFPDPLLDKDKFTSMRVDYFRVYV